MIRIVRAFACLALLAAPGITQQRLDPARMYPITTPIRNAGSVDVTTGPRTRPGQQAKDGGLLVVYTNTCTWQTQADYAGFDGCEENYDEGRIPSPSDPNAPPGTWATT